MSWDNTAMMGGDINVPGAASTAPALADTYRGGIDVDDSTHDTQPARKPISRMTRFENQRGGTQ